MSHEMEILNCSKQDYEEIADCLQEFWGERVDQVKHLYHPIWHHEFGNTAYVMKEQGKVIAHLFGFFSQTAPRGYVHLVAVHRSHQGRGLARMLYAHFEIICRNQGLKEIKAITPPVNEGSIQFHRSIGMKDTLVQDYFGPGVPRVVFTKKLR